MSLGGLPTLASKIQNDETESSETVLHWLFFSKLFFADIPAGVDIFLLGSVSSARDIEVIESDSWQNTKSTQTQFPM